MMQIANLRRTVLRGPGQLLSRFLRGRRGIAQVELALLMPFFALLVVAIVDYGSMINRKMTLANALRAGTQYALIRKPRADGNGNYDTTNIVAAVVNTAPEGVSTSDITSRVFCACPDGVEVICSVGCDAGGTRGSYLELKIQDTYFTMIPYPGIPDMMQLNEEVVVRLN